MNWQQMIIDLEKSGLKQVEIGRLSGCSQGQVSDLKLGRRGERLSYEIGDNLKKLWQERCGRSVA